MFIFLDASNAEDRLLDDILTGYRRYSRPRQNVTDVIIVDIQPCISQVITLVSSKKTSKCCY